MFHQRNWRHLYLGTTTSLYRDTFIENVFYIPDFGQNIFSLIKVATQQKIFTYYKDYTCELIHDHQLVMTRRMTNGSYILDFTVLIPSVAVFYASSYGNISSYKEYQSLETWHTCLGHLHHDMIRKMASNGSVTAYNSKTKNLKESIRVVHSAKVTRQHF